MTSRHEVQDPRMGRVAYWTFRGRAKGAVLYEGMPGFGRRILGQIDPGKDGTWTGRFMCGDYVPYPDRETALTAVSTMVFEELDLEVRTNSRVLVERPGGIVERA